MKGTGFSPYITSHHEEGALAPAQGSADTAMARATFRNEARAVETEIKFAGYLDQQKKSIANSKPPESVSIPTWLDYASISGLSREMRETLERVRPLTIARPAVSPASPLPRSVWSMSPSKFNPPAASPARIAETNRCYRSVGFIHYGELMSRRQTGVKE